VYEELSENGFFMNKAIFIKDMNYTVGGI
jgi:hypothetical protein